MTEEEDIAGKFLLTLDRIHITKPYGVSNEEVGVYLDTDDFMILMGVYEKEDA